jgi:hypothetical protein
MNKMKTFKEQQENKLISAQTQKKNRYHHNNDKDFRFATEPRNMDRQVTPQPRSHNESPRVIAAPQIKVPFEQMPLSQIQAKVNSFITFAFKYWVKKKTSNYLRIGKFYQNMIVFGLAPNTNYLKNIMTNFSEKIKQPSYSFTAHPNRKVDTEERNKVRPYNKHFVYMLKRDGTLEISHISLEAVLELFRVNKQIINIVANLK